MEKQYFDYIARADLKATEYKIILMLLIGSYTAAQLVRELGIMKGNTDRYIKRLRYMGLIQIDRVEGNNKFYRAVKDMKLLEQVMQGQLKM